MRIILFLLFPALATWLSCRSAPAPPAQGNVGDIHFDPRQDDATFQPCRPERIFQYYNFYDGVHRVGPLLEKPRLRAYFSQNLSPIPGLENENGWLTIRFIVNCRGQTGRFRLLEMDAEHWPKRFDRRLSDQLLAAVKGVPGWHPGEFSDERYRQYYGASDYYYYFTFKIQRGAIVDILP